MSLRRVTPPITATRPGASASTRAVRTGRSASELAVRVPVRAVRSREPAHATGVESRRTNGLSVAVGRVPASATAVVVRRRSRDGLHRLPGGGPALGVPGEGAADTGQRTRLRPGAPPGLAAPAHPWSSLEFGSTDVRGPGAIPRGGR